MRPFSSISGVLVPFSLLGVLLALSGQGQVVVWNQPSGASSTGFGGMFPTAYDNFRLKNAAQITAISWSGFYNNATTHGFEKGPITQFSISFYSDAAGKPGTLLSSFLIPGTASESLSTRTFEPTYDYSAVLPAAFTAAGGSDYWVSVAPSLASPWQWAWLDGSGGDGVSYQTTAGRIGSDLTFALYVIPEPGVVPLFLAASFVFASRRRSSNT